MQPHLTTLGSLATGLSLFLISACGTTPTSFRPSDPLPDTTFDQVLLDGVLHRHVRDGEVDYPALAQDASFAQYLLRLKRMDPDNLTTRTEQLAFWINTYNAFAIRGILDGGSPVTAFGKYDYFISRKFNVGGANLNLYGIEHDILIPLGEARIHFTIVCASRSCPKQRPAAYTSERLDQQLDESARRFINDPSRNRFDRENKIAYLSMIFNWFAKDFAADDVSVLRYIAHYVSDPALASELNKGDYSIRYLDYDWSLNGPPPH